MDTKEARQAITQLQEDIEVTKSVYKLGKTGEKIVRCYELAIEALEKQLLRKPIGHWRIPEIGKCQMCKTELCTDDKDLHYCPTCGQKLREVE